MNLSTMLKDIFRFFKGYSINNSITNCCSSHWSKVKSLSDLNICLMIWKQYSHVLS